jgi:predicted aspartyl protease
MTRYRYNRQVEPPAPYVHVTIGRADGGGEPETVAALVDSGADKTVVPQSLVERLRLMQAGIVQAQGLNHVGSIMATYVVRIGVQGMAESVVQVIAAPEEEYVLLGRDVLNRYRVTLDGPGLVCTLE